MTGTKYNSGFGICNNQNESSKTAIQKLKEFNLLEQKIKFPNMPDAYRFTPEYRDTTSNGLTRCITDFIRLSGYFVERTGSEGRVIDDRQTVTDCIGRTKVIGSIKRIRSSGTPGTSDLKAIIKGRFVAIEIKCKATNDRIRPDQLKYKIQIEQSGGLYYVAKDFETFYSWFNQKFENNEQ